MFVPTSWGVDIVAPDIATILGRHANDRTELMDILWEIQHGYGYIPPEAAQQVAGWLDLTDGDVLETASFYHFFHTTPSGRYRIYLSNTAIAKMHGYQQVSDALERETGAKFDGPASPDFGLFETACIGLSDQEPAMLIDDVVFTDLTPTSIADIISQMKQGRFPAEIANPSGLPRSEVAYVDALAYTTVHTSGPTFFSNEADYRVLLDRCLAMRPEEVITTIADPGLRGLGGAGFSTGMKWRLCRAAAGDEKYVICNADEGEPGTFKDHVLLTRSPKQVFVGMIIAAHAIGAARGIVYLRAEYAYLREYLEQQLAELRDEGLLGDGFDLRIQMGAGAYICGDESALIESCEGKRGTPRLKPPFPVEDGFLGKPTCVNNVETFAAVARIMEMGADWFAAMGTTGSTGTRLLTSVSGDCDRPGIHEIEWGVTLREVLEMVGAGSLRPCRSAAPRARWSPPTRMPTANSPTTTSPATAPSWCSVHNASSFLWSGISCSSSWRSPAEFVFPAGRATSCCATRSTWSRPVGRINRISTTSLAGVASSPGPVGVGWGRLPPTRS